MLDYIFKHYIQTSAQKALCNDDSFYCKVAVNSVLGDEHPYLSAATQHNYEMNAFEKTAVAIDFFSLVGEIFSAFSHNSHSDY